MTYLSIQHLLSALHFSNDCYSLEQEYTSIFNDNIAYNGDMMNLLTKNNACTIGAILIVYALLKQQ